MVKDDLLMKRCELAMPPSAAAGNQMIAKDLKKSSEIANVRIYEEQVIRKMKVYSILKIGLYLTKLPLFDDYIRICVAFVNLKSPICK